MTFNADGSTQLGLSSQVLSKSVPYPWEGGIGFHPESFAFTVMICISTTLKEVKL